MKNITIKLGKAMTANDRVAELERLERWEREHPTWCMPGRKDLPEMLAAAREDRERELAPLTEAIKSAEGRATARTITAQQVIDELAGITAGLGIAKKTLVGAEISMDLNAQAFPRSYKWTAQSTILRAEYKTAGWTVTDVRRGDTRKPANRVDLTLPAAAEQAILDRARRGEIR